MYSFIWLWYILHIFKVIWRESNAFYFVVKVFNKFIEHIKGIYWVNWACGSKNAYPEAAEVNFLVFFPKSGKAVWNYLMWIFFGKIVEHGKYIPGPEINNFMWFSEGIWFIIIIFNLEVTPQLWSQFFTYFDVTPITLKFRISSTRMWCIWITKMPIKDLKK